MTFRWDGPNADEGKKMADVDAQGEIRTCAAEVDERFSQLPALSVGNGVEFVGLCVRINDPRRRDGDHQHIHITSTLDCGRVYTL